MRIISFIPALAALVTAVAGVSLSRDVCSSEIGCGPVPPKRDFIEHPSRDGHALTNAQLLRRGLPLNNPVLRRGSPVRRTNPSSVPPPVLVTRSGVIQVLDPNNNVLGYVSKNLGNGGAQYVYDPSLANALAVTFQTVQGGPSTQSQLNIHSSNSNPAWPFLGLIQGRDNTDSNLKPGSYQYGYLGGVDNPGTQPGAPPASISNSYFIGSPRTAETAVWTFNSVTSSFVPQWVNTDGSSPVIKTFTQSTGLYITGDKDAFFARYPAPVTLITFKFVST